jgi:hypothetical protein
MEEDNTKKKQSMRIKNMLMHTVFIIINDK